MDIVICGCRCMGSVSRETIGKGRGGEGEGEREGVGVGGWGLCVRNVLFPCNIAFPLY